jgi:two-component system, NtrC family, nitrogen regulation sensor histidine kinase NtrY
MTGPRGTRTSKLYVAGGLLLILAFIVFAQQAFNLSPFIDPENPDEILLLYTLSTLIFLVLLVLGFILLRILVKTWMERRQGKPGSRFKTSLLGMLGVLTLIPAVSVFAYAYGLVNRSIDKWFSVPVDRIFSKSGDIKSLNEQWYRDNTKAILSYLAANPPSDYAAARRTLKLKALMLIDQNGRVQIEAAEPGLSVEQAGRNALKFLATDKDAVGVDADGDWVGARRIETPDGPRILAGVFPVNDSVAALYAEIAQEREAYRQLKEKQVSYKNRYAALLLIMTLLVLFSAVWVALFLSKRITEPIEALTAATREISAGNLDYRVDVQAVDELATLVTLFNDMASRLKYTTEELETRRRYIEIVLESVPTGVIAIDADFHLHTLNRAARTMFSVGNATSLEQIFKGEDLRNIRNLLEDARDNAITREFSFSTPGRPAASAVTASPLTTGGFVLVVEDLTEVIRAQKASAWREVARRLAHEIKNPLTPIQLSAERISRTIGRFPAATPRITAVMQECVNAITTEVSGLKNLVDEFVRFARLPTVSRVPHNMRDLVDKTLTFYEGRMDGVQVVVDVPPDLPPILMDPLQMKRVLINVIDNALEALTGGIERYLHIGCELTRDGTMARLTLEDNGCGIAPEDRERLFTPYFSTRKEGTGLGLSIASRIISDHGGYIGAEPNTPRGTRFVIELPVCQESLLSTTNQASGSR